MRKASAVAADSIAASFHEAGQAGGLARSVQGIGRRLSAVAAPLGKALLTAASARRGTAHFAGTAVVFLLCGASGSRGLLRRGDGAWLSNKGMVWRCSRRMQLVAASE